MKISHYGLSERDKTQVLEKITANIRYIENHGIEKDSEFIPFAKFTKNAWYNSDKYIAELQNRASSLVAYAALNNLVSLFITLTLPSEYHPTKKLKNGKIIKNPRFIDDDRHTPKAGAKQLSKMWKRLSDLRPIKDLQKDQKCYFRITEPHKSGVPHLHIALYVPKDSIERILDSIFAIYTFPQIEISSQYIPISYQNKLYDKTVKRTVYKRTKDDNFGVTTLIKDPFAYLMKYILKTLDDLRTEQDNFTALTLWYIHHGIGRFYTSRTLIPLWIYRKINYLPKFQNMLNATQDYINGRIRVSMTKRSIDYLWIDKDGELVEKTLWEKWNDTDSMRKRNELDDLKRFWKRAKYHLLSAYTRKHPKIIPLEIDGEKLRYNLTEHKIISKSNPIVPAYLKDKQLYDYYHSLDIEDPNISLLHFGITQNEMIKRGLLDMPLQSLNDFNDDFNYSMEEAL